MIRRPQSSLPAKQKNNSMKIFAYGSNMNIKRLQERTPSARKVTNAFINGYRFSCNKVSNTGSSKGNIVFTNNSSDVVWGVVFEIDDKEKPALDDAEGLGKGYNQTLLTMTGEDSSQHSVQVYVADPRHQNNNLLPFDWYREFIISGAEQNGLPTGYVDSLKRMNAVKDPNEKRREKNYAILEKSRTPVDTDHSTT